MKRIYWIGLSALLLFGCSMFTGKADYRDYRKIKLAETEESRTVAMAEYIQAHPEGKYAPVIQAERQENESTLYEANKSTAEGLRYYLQAYPDGEYSASAQQRLTALASVAQNKQGEADQTKQVIRERRDETLATRRMWGTQSVQFWSKILLGVKDWGKPIAEVARGNEEFSAAFGKEPRPKCSTSECIKFYELNYAIPVPGSTRIDRNLQILLRLMMKEGNLVRAELLMPDRGFSRWYELENQRFVIDEDPDQRQATMEWASERIVPIIKALAADAKGIDVVPEPITPPTVGKGAEEVVAPAAGEDSLVLPLALRGLMANNLRIVVFAAADDDEGTAYDGMFIEFEKLEAEPKKKKKKKPAKKKASKKKKKAAKVKATP